MRIVFSVLGLLIVVAILGSVAKKQLQAVRALPQSAAAAASAVAAPPPGGGRLDAFPGAVAADPSGLTVPQQSQNMQRQVAGQVQQQLQQGAARSAGGGQ